MSNWKPQGGLEAVGSDDSVGIISDGRVLSDSLLCLSTGVRNYGFEEVGWDGVSCGWGVICGPCLELWLGG